MNRPCFLVGKSAICIVSIVALMGFLTNFCKGNNEWKKKKLIIDTDIGGDDAIAILLALSVSEKVQILAITCTYGNTWLKNVEINVLKALTVANQSHIPVYSGADKPLLNNFQATNYFGVDGLGDFVFDKQIVGTIDRTKHAAIAMTDLVKQYPGEISVVTLGPLTNVALAITLDRHFSRNVKRFYVMGSAPPQIGFNFALDPESNEIFLKTPTSTTKLVTSSNVATKYAIPKIWRTDVLGRQRSEQIRFANNAESMVLRVTDVWRFADLITMATFIWPELVTDSTLTHMSLDPCKNNADRLEATTFKDDTENNVQLVTEFDVEGLQIKLLQYFV